MPRYPVDFTEKYMGIEIYTNYEDVHAASFFKGKEDNIAVYTWFFDKPSSVKAGDMIKIINHTIKVEY